jgi:hypothetical protein
MKFSNAWAKTAAQNISLKVATVLLTVVTVIQLFAIIQLSSKTPLVIDRGCISHAVLPRSAQPTTEEIQAFLFETIPARFDSSAFVKANVLSNEEDSLRQRELEAMKQKQMEQKLIVYDVQVSEKEVLVNADRIISVGKVKTVLPFDLKVKVKTTDRTEWNPYGLVLTSTVQATNEKEKK